MDTLQPQLRNAKKEFEKIQKKLNSAKDNLNNLQSQIDAAEYELSTLQPERDDDEILDLKFIIKKTKKEKNASRIR